MARPAGGLLTARFQPLPGLFFYRLGDRLGLDLGPTLGSVFGPRGLELALEVGNADLGLFKGMATQAVGEGELGSEKDVTILDGGATLESGVGAGGFEDHEVSPMPINPQAAGEGGDGRQVAVGVGDEVDELAGAGDLFGELAVMGRPLDLERLGIGLEFHIALKDGDAIGHVADAADVDAEREAVEQLRPEIAFLRVHGADEDKAGRVGERDAFPFDDIDTHGGRVEQEVDDVVVEEVDLVDVEEAAVGGCQDAGVEMALALLDRLLEVERTDDPVLGSADGQVDKAGAAGDDGQFLAGGDPFATLVTVSIGSQRVTAEAAAVDDVDAGQQGRQGTGSGRLGGAALAPNEDAADAGIDGVQDERSPHPLLADDSGEREYSAFDGHDHSSWSLLSRPIIPEKRAPDKPACGGRVARPRWRPAELQAGQRVIHWGQSGQEVGEMNQNEFVEYEISCIRRAAGKPDGTVRPVEQLRGLRSRMYLLEDGSQDVLVKCLDAGYRNPPNFYLTLEHEAHGFRLFAPLTDGLLAVPEVKFYRAFEGPGGETLQVLGQTNVEALGTTLSPRDIYLDPAVPLAQKEAVAKLCGRGLARLVSADLQSTLNRAAALTRVSEQTS